MTKKSRYFQKAGTLHFHFIGKYSKLARVKTMGTRRKINAIWWNIKINLHKLADICGCELPTNLQNFTKKDLTEVKIPQKVLGGYFFETPCTCDVWRWISSPSQARIDDDITRSVNATSHSTWPCLCGGRCAGLKCRSVAVVCQVGGLA